MFFVDLVILSVPAHFDYFRRALKDAILTCMIFVFGSVFLFLFVSPFGGAEGELNRFVQDRLGCNSGKMSRQYNEEKQCVFDF